MPKTILTSLHISFLILFALCTTGELSAQINIELDGENPICFGLASGSITSTVTGGTLPYTYNWSTGDEEPFIQNLPAGEYSLTVTDANGMGGTATITLTEPPIVTLEVSADQNCEAPFTLTADAGGGVGDFIYNWSTGDDTPQIVVSDEIEYCVTVVDGNGCGTFECITPESNPPSVEVVAVDVLCFGDENGSLTATGNGGTPPYTFSWSNGDSGATINNLGPGVVTVTLTDAAGCTATATGTVNEPPLLTSTTTSLQDVCPDESTGSATVMPNGGTPPYSYLWSTGATTQIASNLSAGTFSVTVTDANDCTVVDEVTIIEFDGPEVTIEGGPVICGVGNTVDITAIATGGTGNYQFEWSTNEFTQTITVGPGTYSVTVEDGNGCTDTETITIEEIDVNITLTSTNILCNGDDNGTATVTVTGGDEPYEFDWSNGETTPTITGLAPGTYTVIVTEANGCKATGSVTITEPPALGVSADVTDVLCNGDETGAIDLTVTGGTPPYTFLWSNGAMTEDLDNLPAGSYTGTVTDANGCTISATLMVTEPPALDVSADVTNVLCNGDATGAIDLTVTGGTAPYTFLWSNGAMTEDLMNIPAGSYTGTVTDANGCTISATLTVTEPPALGVSADVTNVLCNGDETGAIDLTVTGGTAPYTLLWSNGAMTEDLMNIPAGSYTGTVTDANGCTISATVTITEPPALGVSADVTNIDCNGDVTGAIDLTVIGGTAPYTFLWSNGAMTEDLMNIPAGSYTGTVTDAFGFTISATVTITEPPALGVSADVTNVDCNGDATGAIDLTVTGGTAP
ncbi:MAG: SprB repeat-containing protein, partial [Bacteroidota bacterium]